MPPIKRLLLGLSFLLLSACSSSNGGGGGGGGEVEVEVEVEPALIGQFIDSAVSGIRYETATRSGITNGEGQFEYLSGETVHFYIGEQLLGDAPGAASVTRFDLVDGVTPVVGKALVDAIWNWKNGPGFSTVINLATLLQTLDSDGNPDNGIEVTAGIAALFAADSVDFDQHWQEFSRDSGFRHVLSAAKANAILDEYRQIRKPWRVMDHLYTSLGIDSKLSAVTNREAENADFLGGRARSSVRFEFDAEGKLTQEGHIVQGSHGGPTTYSTSYVYDANGNLIRSEQQHSNTNPLPIVSIFTYDPMGDLIRTERDDNFDGSPDDITTYTYDANGNRTREEYDTNADGTPDQIHNYAYDANGNLLRMEEDSDGSGLPPKLTVTMYTYDANDNLIHTEVDFGFNLKKIYSYSYDDNNNLLRYTFDYNADGNPDQIEIYAYDDNGNLTREEEYDSRGDGSPDRIVSYTYDDIGNPIRVEYDDDGDGVPDSYATATYDGKGNLVRGVDYSDWLSVEQVYLFTYDADSNLISAESYYDYSVPTPIYSYNHTWDPDVDGWWDVFNNSPESDSVFFGLF